MQVFDIETGPQPRDEVMKFWEKPESKLPPTFDPASVRLGNLKDEVKKAAKIEECRAAHQSELANEKLKFYDSAERFYNDAALKAHTGRVLTIGVGDVDLQRVKIMEVDAATSEEGLLTKFWSVASACISRGESMVGFNILAFDLPYLVRRSWLLGVDIPPMLFSRSGRYVNWHPLLVDLMVVWGMGEPFAISLDLMARAFGLPGKPDGLTGADFAGLYTSADPLDVQKALEYAAYDIRTLMSLSAKLQLV